MPKKTTKKKTTKTSPKAAAEFCMEKGDKMQGGTAGFIYVLGFIGSLVYFLSTATSLWEGVIGFFKAIFWPAFLVHAWLVFLAL